MSRQVPEWRGATDDAAIPKRVKLRIWTREGGRCYLTGKKIMPGDAYEFEHVLALCNGGEHREANIRVALSTAHKAKTAKDVDIRAKTDRIRAKHLGLKPENPRGFKAWRTFSGSIVRRGESLSPIPTDGEVK